MTKLYMILPLDGVDAGALSRKINDICPPGSRYDGYAPKVWFVSFRGTAKQLSDAVGFTEGPAEGVVAAIGSNWGYAYEDLWTWVSNNS